MRAVFRAVARDLGLSFFDGAQEALPVDCGVFLQNHARVDLDALQPARAVHLVRDPRDVIISAAHYHLTADEPWLHEPRNPTGQTYQQSLRRCTTLDARLDFEMRHASGRTIRDMQAWPYGRSDVIEVRYEDLVQDSQLELFHRIYAFLGIPGGAMPTALQHAWDHSLFSGRVASDHVRSGRVEQWRSVFTRPLGERFLERHPTALRDLGYEPDDSWVEELPPSR